jgi:uncharacterized protein (DUF2225 family)
MLMKTAIDLTCPACLQLFGSIKVSAMPKIVQKATDCREVYHANVRVLPYCVHLCEACGYAGYASAFRDHEIDVGTRSRIAQELEWNIDWAKRSTVEKFHHALKCAEWLDEPIKALGDLALNASWASFEENDAEAARYFRRAAAAHFDAALKQYDGVAARDRAGVTYIMGELYRRLGQQDLADQWYRQAEVESTTPADQWVSIWAVKQRTSPQEFFS